MTPKKVLLISPTGREYRELPAVAARLGCEVIYEEFAGDFFDDLLSGDRDGVAKSLEILPLIEETIRRHERTGIAGVTSGVGYPGMPVAAVIAERLGLPGPTPRSVLLCEHKYYSRVAQSSLVPWATPRFNLVDPGRPDAAGRLEFPFFLKPVKSCFSINADVIHGPEELREKIGAGLLPESFLKPMNDLLGAYTDFPLGASYLLAESLMEGTQVSLEGYVSGGKMRVMGVIDSVMYPGTFSFKRFEYPSQLAEGVRERMARAAETFMRGIGYDNALFNIEFMYNPRTDEVHIIEVNPKIASQFTDLFEKVDGRSSYYPLLQAALGEEPDFPTGRGEFRVAASCVLRTFEDRRVERAPTPAQVQTLMDKFPDARVEVCAREGELLSSAMQDGKSFRYALVNIGADSLEELETKLEDCERLLDFQFTAP